MLSFDSQYQKNKNPIASSFNDGSSVVFWDCIPTDEKSYTVCGRFLTTVGEINTNINDIYLLGTNTLTLRNDASPSVAVSNSQNVVTNSLLFSGIKLEATLNKNLRNP